MVLHGMGLQSMSGGLKYSPIQQGKVGLLRVQVPFATVLGLRGEMCRHWSDLARCQHAQLSKLAQSVMYFSGRTCEAVQINMPPLPHGITLEEL